MARLNNQLKQRQIGVFSSASPLCYYFKKRVIKTKELFLKHNFDINFGSLIFKHIGKYSTGSIKQRANEFNELLENNLVLMGSIGGFNSSSILPYINYQKIKHNHTKIIGLSDHTAILLAVYKKTGLKTYYGQSFLKSYYENNYIQKINFDALNQVVFKNQYPIILKQPTFYDDTLIDWNNEFAIKNRQLKNNKWIWYNKQVVTGRLIGGNLNTIISMLGTIYMPTIKTNDILLLEDSTKSISECERSFATLKNAKIFDKVNAIIVGKCELIDQQDTNLTYEKLLLKFVDRKIPILTKFDCGHTYPSYLLKIGGTIKLDPFKNQVVLLD